jgi:ABC-type transport system involved in multi-copper enzyme maturation permease subunit
MLGGRRRWLVLLALSLPVLLTLALRLTGALAPLDREFGTGELVDALREGTLPARYVPFDWPAGTDAYFWSVGGRDPGGGIVQRTFRGLLLDDRPVQSRDLLVWNDGALVLFEKELWSDPNLPAPHERPGLAPYQLEINADIRGERPPSEFFLGLYLYLLYPQVTCLLLALLYGSSVLANELDGKTLPYLWTRPIRRASFVFGKHLGIVLALSGPTALSLCASWALLTRFEHPRLLLTTLLVSLAALLCYNALFLLLGFLSPRRGMILGLLYGILFELLLSFVPAVINQATVSYFLRSLYLRLGGLSLTSEMPTDLAGASLPLTLFALGLILLLPLLAATLLATHREYAVKDEA